MRETIRSYWSQTATNLCVMLVVCGLIAWGAVAHYEMRVRADKADRAEFHQMLLERGQSHAAQWNGGTK